jgi:hypothetical protein
MNNKNLIDEFINHDIISDDVDYNTGPIEPPSSGAGCISIIFAFFGIASTIAYFTDILNILFNIQF